MLNNSFTLHNLFLFFRIHHEPVSRNGPVVKSPSKKSNPLTRLFGFGHHAFNGNTEHDPCQCNECVELDLVLQKLPESRAVSQLHFGSKYRFVKRYKTLGKGAEG